MLTELFLVPVKDFGDIRDLFVSIKIVEYWVVNKGSRIDIQLLIQSVPYRLSTAVWDKIGKRN